MKRLIIAAVLSASASASASAEFFAIKANAVGNGIELVTELSTEQRECSEDFRFARVNIVKMGADTKIPHSVGCWILMPNSEVVVRLLNVATKKEDTVRYTTSDFWTLQKPEYWYQFTPGYAKLMAAEKRETATASKDTEPAEFFAIKTARRVRIVVV